MDDRYWILLNVNATNGPSNWEASGDLVGIVDEQEGGIIAYCHRDTATRLLNVLTDEVERDIWMTTAPHRGSGSKDGK